MSVSEDDARRLALAHLSNPSWEPAVVEIEDASTAWRVFYNSKAYIETGVPSSALAGNLPLLIDKSTGEVTVDTSYAPGSDRWRT